MRNYIFTDRDRGLLKKYFDGTVIDGLRQLKRTVLSSREVIETDYALFQNAVNSFGKGEKKKKIKPGRKKKDELPDLELHVK